jgi:hypothetical protein
MQKVEMIETESFGVSEPDRTHCPEGSIVTVINKSNEKIRLFNGAATGMPLKPMSNKQLSDKFMLCAETQLAPEQANALLKRLRSIEKVALINDLFGD